MINVRTSTRLGKILFMNKNFRDRFAKSVRQLRGERSQGEFARALGCSQPTITGWENGQSIPNLDNLDRLAELSNQLPEEFLANLYGRQISTAAFPKLTDAIANMTCTEVSAVTMAIANRLAKGEH